MGVYSESTLFIGITSAAYASYMIWTASLLLSSMLRRASKIQWRKEGNDSEFFCFFSAPYFLALHINNLHCKEGCSQAKNPEG